MAVITYSTVVNVCEDTNRDFDIRPLLAQAGYTGTAPFTITGLMVSDGAGGYVPAPTNLFTQVDADTVRVTAANLANYFGSFDTLSIVLEGTGGLVTLNLKVVIDPVNDAPSGQDAAIDVTSNLPVVLRESDFRFTDIENNGLKSVVFTSLPAAGRLLLDGQALAAGAEVSAADIRAGLLTYVPAQGATGTVALSFQVRDDGGTAGCNAADLDPTPNTLTLHLPALATLGDRVWRDTDGDGLQDNGELGFAGVTVRLLDTQGHVVATTSTDANGNYQFTGLLPGDYRVQVVAPDGYKFTTPDAGGNDAVDSDVIWDGAGSSTGTSGVITLAPGENDNTVDAGLKVCLVSLGDRIWWDANGNGLQDAGEAGIGGVTVKLIGAGADGQLGTADDTVRTTTTDANGAYRFTDVAWGQYKVALAAPDGWQATAADVGANDQIDSDFRAVTTTTRTDLIVNGSFETLVNGRPTGWYGIGDTIEVNNASYYGVSGASGSKVVELDANYTCDSGTGLGQRIQTVAGQTYTLTVDLAQRAGTASSTNTVEIWWRGARIATIDPTSTAMKTYTFTVTGSGGSDELAFREQSCDDNGAGGIIDNVHLTTTSTTTVWETAPVTVARCDDDLSIDGGLVLTKPASLGDRVWLDVNGNGLQDAGEAGFAGATVRLLNAAGQVVATQTTDASGNYLFTGLPPGQYQVQVVAPDGYRFTTADAGGNDAIDSDLRWDGTGTSTGTSALVTLAAGENNRSVDAGLKVCLVSIGDRVWLDGNGNGVQDPGESGVGCVTVQLKGAGADGVFGTADDVLRTTTTDAAGNYRFDGVAWGAYKLALALPNGYGLTTADVGGDDRLDSDFRAVGTAAGSNLVVNGSFEQRSGGAVLGWTGLGDVIEVGGASAYGVTGANGSNVVELDANRTGTSGTGLYQDILTEAGRSYQLSVDLASKAGSSSSTNTVEVWWNGTRIASIDPTSTTLKTYSFKVTGTGGADRLSFREQACDDDGVGGIIDNVRLTPTGSGTAYETGVFSVQSCDDNLTLDAGLVQKSCVKLIGCDSIYEGSSGSFQLQLERALAVDTTVTVTIVDGSAHLVGGSASNQTVAAGGGYTDPTLGNVFFANQYYDPTTGMRCQTANAPADQCWDFGVRDAAGGWVSTASASFTMTIKAGQTLSDAFVVDAWKEKVYADLNCVGSSDYREAAWETFGLQLSGGNALTSFCEPCKTVSIGDCSTYYTYSPIVLDLDGNGIQTRALIDAGGTFDLLGTGHAVQSGWISSGDAFLAVDANGNGRIDDVSELFGGAERGLGFAKLAGFDSNGDGVVDAHDAGFSALKVWQDANGNHHTDAGELRTLAEAGIASLDVAFVDRSIDQLGNVLGEAGRATGSDGRAIDMVDVYFNVYADDAAAARAALPPADALLSADDALLDRALPGACIGGVAIADAAPAGDDSAALLRQVIAAMKNAGCSVAAVA